MTYKYEVSFSQTRAIVALGHNGYHIIVNADLPDDERERAHESALTKITEQKSASPGQLFCLPQP